MAFTPSPVGPVVDEPIRPRAAWFWIGGGVIALGVIGAIVGFVLGFSGLDDTIDDFERAPYPGGGTVTIDEPGEYVIYGEDRFSTGNRFLSARVDLFDPDGNPVDTRDYAGELNYDFGGRSGIALATFTATDAGEFEFRAVDDDSSNVVNLAVGESIGDDLVRSILIPMAIGGLGLAIGAIILIVTGVRRGRAKRDRGGPAPPPPGTWGQAPATWGPQGQTAQPAWGQQQQPPPPGAPPPGTSQQPPSPPPSPGAAPNPPPPPGWPN